MVYTWSPASSRSDQILTSINSIRAKDGRMNGKSSAEWMDVALYKNVGGWMRVSGDEQVEAVVYICFRPPLPHHTPTCQPESSSTLRMLGQGREWEDWSLVAVLPGTSPPAQGDLQFQSASSDIKYSRIANIRSTIHSNTTLPSGTRKSRLVTHICGTRQNKQNCNRSICS